jgi:hypothetical protein
MTAKTSHVRSRRLAGTIAREKSDACNHAASVRSAHLSGPGECGKADGHRSTHGTAAHHHGTAECGKWNHAEMR